MEPAPLAGRRRGAVDSFPGSASAASRLLARGGLPVACMSAEVFRISLCASRAHIHSSGGYGSYGFVRLLAAWCAVIERA